VFTTCQFVLKLSPVKFEMYPLSRPGSMAHRRRKYFMPTASPALSKSLPEERLTSTEQTLASSPETIERSQSEEIARLAYALWQQRGCPVGSAETDWLEAEQQLSR
jgi:Protein of unknown function (DUF2934)